jgi:hypothetical protein
MVSNADITRWRKERNQPYIIASMPIMKGEEIIVKYGTSYGSYA